MVERHVRKAEEAAAEVVRAPMVPREPVGQPSLQEAAREAERAAGAVVGAGPSARELAREQRRAEDRQLIMDVAGRHGITLTEERVEEIRLAAWRAADRAAHRDETRAAAMEAGKAEAGWGDVQAVRNAISRVIGSAASEAALGIITEELRKEGLSGDALRDAAGEIAQRAGQREVRDAWGRGGAIGGQHVAAQLVREARQAAEEEVPARPAPEESQEAPAAEEAGLHARALVFRFGLGRDFNAIANAINNNIDFVMNYEDRAAKGNPRVYEGLMALDQYLDRYGLRGGGHIEIRIDLEKIRAAGYAIDEERVGEALRTNPEAVLRHFAGLGVEGAVEIVQTGGAAGGLRPPGTRMEASELLQLMGMMRLAEEACAKIAQQGNERQPRMLAYGISGHAQA